MLARRIPGGQGGDSLEYHLQMSFIVALLLILVLAAGCAYVVAGRAGCPSIQISKPDKFVGVSTPLEVAIGAPGGHLKSISIAFEQGGKSTTLYSIADGQVAAGEGVKLDGADVLRITRTIGKQTVPDLKTGAARIVVTASRPVMRGLRTLASSASHDVQVRLERPQVSVLSSKHYVNLGGSEMVVYRATPPDVQSGVLVGDIEYP